MTAFNLDSPGNRWVRESLKQGRALSELVLRQAPLDVGGCWADVPEGWSLDPASIDFKRSGAPGGTETQDEYFDDRASRLLSTDTVLVVEDDLWDPGDRPHEPKQGVAVIFDATRLFVYVPGGPIGPASFVRRYSSGYPRNAFFVPLPEPRLLGAGPASWLPAAVPGLQALVVGAWDAEGFIWWLAPSASSSASGTRS